MLMILFYMCSAVLVSLALSSGTLVLNVQSGLVL